MRFTCAFISTLLFALTVLAVPPTPYAGYKVVSSNKTQAFFMVTTTFIVPQIDCGLGGPQTFLYVAARIGDPTLPKCKGGAEASIRLACHADAYGLYEPFGRLYPEDVVHIDSDFKAEPGQVVQIGILVSEGEVQVWFNNLVTRKQSDYWPVGPLSDLLGCQSYVSWVLRGEVNGGRLVPLTPFQGSMELVDCQAWSATSLGTFTWFPANGTKEVMKDEHGFMYFGADLNIIPSTIQTTGST